MQDSAIHARVRSNLGGPLRLSRRHALAAGAAAVLVAAAVVLATGMRGWGLEATVIAVPGAPTGIVAAGDVVWVSSAGSHAVWPIEAASGRQAGPGIRTGGAPSRLAVGADGLWIVDNARGSVIPVDTRAQEVFGHIEVGADVTDVELAAGAVWVASSAERVVRAIEPSGRPVRRLPVGGEPVDIAAGGRWIAVASAADGALARIDARTRRAFGEPVQLGGLPVAVAVSGDTAWVADAARGTVAGVDLLTGRPGQTVAVGGKPIAVAADEDEVWVLCRDDRTLVRVDGRAGEVLDRHELEQDPTAMALDDRYVWVASAAGREVLRIAR